VGPAGSHFRLLPLRWQCARTRWRCSTSRTALPEIQTVQMAYRLHHCRGSTHSGVVLPQFSKAGASLGCKTATLSAAESHRTLRIKRLSMRHASLLYTQETRPDPLYRPQRQLHQAHPAITYRFVISPRSSWLRSDASRVRYRLEPKYSGRTQRTSMCKRPQYSRRHSGRRRYP